VAERQDRARPGSGRQAGAVPASIRGREKPALRAALVAFSANPQPVRMEVLGVHLRRSGTRRGDRGVLAAAELRRNSRLRADGNHFDDLVEPSVSYRQTLYRKGAGGARNEAR